MRQEQRSSRRRRELRRHHAVRVRVSGVRHTPASHAVRVSGVGHTPASHAPVTPARRWVRGPVCTRLVRACTGHSAERTAGLVSPTQHDKCAHSGARARAPDTPTRVRVHRQAALTIHHCFTDATPGNKKRRGAWVRWTPTCYRMKCRPEGVHPTRNPSTGW